jgi:hypothetical protein
MNKMRVYRNKSNKKPMWAWFPHDVRAPSSRVHRGPGPCRMLAVFDERNAPRVHQMSALACASKIG